MLTYGGILHGLRVPDPAGRVDDIVLGLPAVEDYAADSPYFGALVGRYANRIDGGRFTLDGREHRIPVNDRGHALHGGPEGFHRRVWEGRPGAADDDGVSLDLHLHSPDGDMGFPGALDVTVTYRLDRAGTLSVDYRARTDRPTVVNLTNHSYFNLAGAGRGDVLRHTLAVDAASYLPVTAEAIPLGPPAPTAGTPFDFTRPTRSATASPPRTHSSPAPAATTTAGCSPRPPTAGRACAAPPGSPTPAAAAGWRCGPPNPASRSTPATRWTAPSPAPTPNRTSGTRRSAWRPSTSRTPRTARSTPAPSCARTGSSAAAPSSDSPICVPKREESPPRRVMKTPRRGTSSLRNGSTAATARGGSDHW